MDILLDTHIALWALADSDKLSDAAREIIENPGNRIFVSDLSVWEIALKHVANPEAMRLQAAHFHERCEEAGYLSLPLALDDVYAFETLAASSAQSTHKDPFDRMLIAQSKTQNLLLLTHDRSLSLYHEPRVSVV